VLPITERPCGQYQKYGGIGSQWQGNTKQAAMSKSGKERAIQWCLAIIVTAVSWWFFIALIRALW